MPKLPKGLVWAICPKCQTIVDMEDIDPEEGCAGFCPECNAYVFANKNVIPNYEQVLEYFKRNKQP